MHNRIPQRVQLAVQGGGAKVFALLAALDAVQQLSAQGKLEVTRIAGTSAGALAASLFAAGLDLKTLRYQLENLGQTVVGEYQRPRFWDFVRLAFSGRPIWSMDSLGKMMDDLLSQTGISKIEQTVQKTGTELLIVSSDLHESKRVVHREGFVTNAVLDSCGIPFCFRTWSQPKANIVDGGICENLPVEALVNETAAYGPVVGISFERTRPRRPQDIRSFSAAILDAAIDNSVERAINRIGTDRVLSILCPFGTLDFEEALKEGTGPLYDNVWNQSKTFFDTFIDPEEMNVGDPWESGDLNNMLRIGEMFEKQHRHIPVKRHKSILDVTVHSLEKKDEPDVVAYSTTISAVKEPIYCHAISMSSAQHKTLIQKTQLMVFNEKTQQRVEAVRIYMKLPSSPDLRYVLLCFVPALAPGDGPYTITTVDSVYEAMSPLQSPPYADEMRMTAARAVDTIGELDFIIRLPSKYPNASFRRKHGEDWGHPMTDWELKDKSTPGFKTLGWSELNLDPSKSWAIDITLY